MKEELMLKKILGWNHSRICLNEMMKLYLY